jgi:hypothetical protein
LSLDHEPGQAISSGYGGRTKGFSSCAMMLARRQQFQI